MSCSDVEEVRMITIRVFHDDSCRIHFQHLQSRFVRQIEIEQNDSRIYVLEPIFPVISSLLVCRCKTV